MLLNPDRLIFTNRLLKHFINGGLGTSQTNDINGFSLVDKLLEASAYNTYVETVCNKADTLYLRLREGLTEMPTYSYLDYIKRLSNKFDWKSKNFVLAFDYTDEDFYGNVQGFDIHGWKKNSPVNGKFKFLTCSIVSDDIPQKIPLISIPIQMGHHLSYAVTHCLSLVKPFIGKIKLLLFDRGYYNKELMYDLIEFKLPFLIFVPKHKNMKEILYPMEDGEKFTVIWDNKLNRDKSNFDFQYYLSFMKQIYSKKCDTNFDWVFATNVLIDLDEIIRIYRKRWRIETGFRVQDEARIKCKSKEMKIRYFLFMFQQMLQTQWMCFYKEDVPFKRFIIEMHKLAMDLVKKPKANYGKP